MCELCVNSEGSMGLTPVHRLPLSAHVFTRLTVGLQRGWDSLECMRVAGVHARAGRRETQRKVGENSTETREKLSRNSGESPAKLRTLAHCSDRSVQLSTLQLQRFRNLCM